MSIYPFDAKLSADQRVSFWDSVDITVVPEAANVIQVTLVFKDVHGDTVSGSVWALIWLSGSASGLMGNGVAPDGGVAFPLGSGVELDATEMVYLFAGDGSLVLVTSTESGAKTLYLCVGHPDGSVIVSDPLTWAA